MTSGGGPEGYCKDCGEYSQSRSVIHEGLCMACFNKRESVKDGCGCPLIKKVTVKEWGKVLNRLEKLEEQARFNLDPRFR